MKAALCKSWGEPASLVLEDVPNVPLTEGEVRIAVHAAGINPADILAIAGKFQLPPTLPFSPGFEAAGEVIESNSSDVKVGSRVLAVLPYFKDGNPHFGAFAQELVALATNVLAIPDNIDFSEAAALPVIYGTAHIALGYRAQLQPGETLLVTGGTGGTGSAAIQVGKKMGATVIATTSGAQKLKVLQDMGAHAIDYKTENVAEKVLEITDGKGANVIFETVGGDLFAATTQCIAFEGRILPIGAASGKIPEVSILVPLVKNCSIVGTDFAAYTLRDIERVRNSLREILSWYNEGFIKPVPPRTMPLEKAAEALAAVANAQAGGKLVLNMK
ncbi:NADPH:quinone oxidoreductase family protein [Hassallia byssoidea VB512170]|uniref:NADPH:quinone oxidoreductase family protein n=1 Tax=Hassallia byssoidea VB512170 TaxID=1304833 RepID=A0A846H6V1_9CYAN|nr:NADPH:quinone oxidoreductase family protein [Hassalia byssoidea]NEU73407.1 NADPH:quinone oxidoreductase family protein [Hassalia byssoidea VB512170]